MLNSEPQLLKKLFSLVLILYVSQFKSTYSQSISNISNTNSTNPSTSPPIQTKIPPNIFKQTPPTYIVKIDMGVTSNSKLSYSNPWGTSNFTNNYAYAANYTFNTTYEDLNHTLDLNPISPSDKMYLNLGDETLGNQINYLNIIKDGTYLNFGSDIQMTADISPRIIPADYFNKALFTSQSDVTPIVSCKYTNKGPSYKRSILKNVNIDNVVNTFNKNLGIKNDELGIKIMEMEDFTLKYASLDEYIKANSDGKKFSETNMMNFTQLMLSQDFLNYNWAKYVLTAVTEDKNIYIYNITDKDKDNFNIMQWDVINKTFVPNMTNIKKVSLYYGNVIITSSSGLSILYKNSTKGWTVTNYNQFPINNTNYPLNLIDSLLVNSTLYMIIDNFGLISFDMVKMQFNSNFFSHPRLVQLDYIAFRNLFYIGILVDNAPPSIPEFFIEMTYNYEDPSALLINRVYTSYRDINIKDIATDNMLGLTYIMEPISNNLYIITRGIGNSIETYNFIVDFKGFYNFTQSKKLELMFISEDTSFYPSLVIYTGEDYVLFSRFSYPKNSLSCKMSVDGSYTYSITSPMECSKFYNGKFNYNTCWNNSTINIKADSSIPSDSQDFKDDSEDKSIEVDSEDYTGLWVVVGIVILAVIIIVVLVVCCRHRICRKDNHGKRIPNATYMKHGAEEVEVQVMDNKL